MSVDQKKELALAKSLSYAQKASPYYQKILANFKFDHSKKCSLELKKIPFTTKEDIHANNTAFLAIPKSQVAEYVSTSGTTGDAITCYLSRSDLKRLAQNEASSFRLTGTKAGDVFQLTTTIDRQFMAGLAYQLGVQEIEAGLIRTGPGLPELQWKNIFEHEVTVLIAVPSFVITLLEYAKKHHIDVNKSKVRSLICIGEAIREEDFTLNKLGRKIQSDWNVELFSSYASTEMAAAFTECTAHQGLHLNPDLLFLEHLTEKGEETKPGELGEIVITHLGVEAMPLIRYKTGDLCYIHRGKCLCGKDSIRLSSILGRLHQRIKFKGTSLFPTALFSILDDSACYELYKIQVQKNEFNLDEITILVDEKWRNTLEIQELLEKFKARLKVVPTFVFKEKNELHGEIFKKEKRKPEKIEFSSSKK